MSLISEQPQKRESVMLGAKRMSRRRGSASERFAVLPPAQPRADTGPCDNCKGRFIAWYGTEEGLDAQAVDVEKCGVAAGIRLSAIISKTGSCR
jgi:hypothetical protein